MARPVSAFMGDGPHSDLDRLKIRIMDTSIDRAEAMIGGPLMVIGGQANLLERLQHILRQARGHNV